MSDFSGYRILVVDDVPDNLHLIQTLLEIEGYEVETAENGKTALERVGASPPNLILLDVMMPDIDGYEVTKQIRQNRSLPYIPILLVSAHETLDTVKASDSEVDAFIRKPIDSDELLSSVKLFCW